MAQYTSVRAINDRIEQRLQDEQWAADMARGPHAEADAKSIRGFLAVGFAGLVGVGVAFGLTEGMKDEVIPAPNMIGPETNNHQFDPAENSRPAPVQFDYHDSQRWPTITVSPSALSQR